VRFFLLGLVGWLGIGQAAPWELPKAVIQDSVEQQVVTLGGRLEAFERVALPARVKGYIQAIYVDLGDRVQQGQVIAELSVPELEAKARMAQAKLAAIQAELARQEQILRFKTRIASRLHRLASQRQGAVTEEEIDRADNEQVAVEAGVEVLRAKLSVAKAALENARAFLEFAKLKAPFDAIVTGRLVHTGALVAETTPIVELVALAKLRLVIEVPQRIAPYLRLGNLVRARFNALPGKVFDATISRIAAGLNGEGKLRAEADLPFAPGLLPGLEGQVAVFLW
jgi:RND family efflux transporter MFP subunit